MSDKVSDEFLSHQLERFARAAKDTGPLGDPVWAARMRAACEELLQRRKDGGSPEEFVVQMASRLSEVAPELQGNFLSNLSAIRESLQRIRTIEGPLTSEERDAGMKWLESLP